MAAPEARSPSDAVLLLIAWVTGFCAGVFWLFLGASGVALTEYFAGWWLICMAGACLFAPFRATAEKFAQRRRGLIAWTIMPAAVSVLGFALWLPLTRLGIL